MNFEKVQRRKRKAISPVLATVILIAITLIAAIAIAGFVFGLFGSFTSSARVSAAVTTCTRASPATCNLSVQNTGTSNVAATACFININGVSTTGTVGGTSAYTAGAGAVSTTCSIAATTGGAAGSSVVGSLQLTNGATVPFTAVWS